MSKVVIGLSGGVDSAVGAYLLKQAGYEVVGLHLLLLPNYCTDSRSAEDAKMVAEHLGIEFHTLDGREIFQQEVIEPFADDYFHGRTPSPCLECNRKLKFGLMADYAKKIGAEYLATGHYATIKMDETGEYYLAKGTDLKKDQSYFLCRIAKEVLPHLIFPLSDYNKTEIRQIAENIGLKVADKPESQEVCFISDNDYKSFLHIHFGEGLGGELVDEDGKVLLKHDGVENFTIGQRKGLGVALGKVVYVTKIEAKTGKVHLGDNEALMQTTLWAKDNVFHKNLPIGEAINIEAKVRYRANCAKAILWRINEKESKVIFAEAQRAITPGQSVCYYWGERVLGGGVIDVVGEEKDDEK